MQRMYDNGRIFSNGKGKELKLNVRGIITRRSNPPGRVLRTDPVSEGLLNLLAVSK